MEKEIVFAKTLEAVKQMAREQGNCVTKEQIEEAFAEMDLAEEQLELIVDYLQKHKIGIGEQVNPDDYLTEEESNYIDTYLEELQLLKEVSEGEREAITLSAMAGDIQAQKRLIEIYLPQVVEIAKLYSGQGVFMEDLIGEGNVAVAAGVSMLGCLEHAREAQGMLGKMVMDAMEDYISENMEESKADQKVLERVNKVADQARELAEELQRKVTVEELAEETKLSKEVILEAIRISGGSIEYIEAQ